MSSVSLGVAGDDGHHDGDDDGDAATLNLAFS
jgi:hypothetical protein